MICVNIVYFDLGVGDDYIYYGSTSFRGKRKKDLLLLSKQEQEIFQTDQVSKIFPQFYIIKVKDFDDIARDTLDEWINFLKTQEIKEGTKAKGLKEAKEKLNYLNLTEEEKREYQRYIENWRDNESIIVGNYNKGKYEGEANKEKYAEEKLKEKELEIARKCLNMGMSIKDVEDITGISEAEIRALVKG